MIDFYHGLRRDTSLLLSEGHPEAKSYPLAVVWSEVRIVRQRHADRIKQDAVLMQLVVASVMDAKAGKQLGKTLKRMDESD